MNTSTQVRLIALFLAGWLTYTFTLFDVGRFSISLSLLASIALAFWGVSFSQALTVPVASILTSGLLAWCVATVYDPGNDRAFTHLVQQLIGVGVLIGARSLNWQAVFPRFRQILLWLSVAALGYGIYQVPARQFGLPYAFLPITNQQVSTDDGLQRGAIDDTRIAQRFTRVSSFMAEPSDLGRWMLWVVALGYACNGGRLRLYLLGVGVAGVLISQSMGGVVGLVLLTLFVAVSGGQVRRLFAFVALSIPIVAALYYFAPSAFDTIATRASLIVSDRDDYLLTTGRFRDTESNNHIIGEAPLLGHGLASADKVASDNIVSGTMQLVLMERGLVGAILFFGPFVWALFRLMLSKCHRSEAGRASLLLLLVELYSFSTFAMMYFPVIYLALGVALNVPLPVRSRIPIERRLRPRSRYQLPVKSERGARRRWHSPPQLLSMAAMPVQSKIGQLHASRGEDHPNLSN